MFGEALFLASNPERIHCRLSAAFGGNYKITQNRVLFRVDEGPTIIVQSERPPDWDLFERKPRLLRTEPETKEVRYDVVLGQKFGFRLLVRPSVKCNLPFCWWSPQISLRQKNELAHNPNYEAKEICKGKRFTPRTDTDRIKWLKRKSLDSGFIVESIGITNLSVGAIKWSGESRAKGSTFAAVQFDGVLVVTDPEKLKNAIRQGIGTQKAFGFGLLSLARIE